MRDSQDVHTYPPARRSEQVDEYHGVRVPDPYRWLEDPDSDESRTWIEAQNRLTYAFLERIPARRGIAERLRKLWNYERYGVPWTRGGRYFFTRNDGLQEQDVFYTMPSLDAEPRVLLDPNRLSEDGTVAVVEYAVSEDARLLAYAVSAAGSDWLEIRVREVETGRDLPDRLRWVKFSSASWDHSSVGFFYNRYDEPDPSTLLEAANYGQKLYYHRMGTPQTEDVLVYERPDQKEWGFGSRVTEDGRYLVLHVWKGTDPTNLIFYKDLSDPSAGVVELVREFEAEFRLVGSNGSVLWFKTDLDAPRGRLVAIDAGSPAREDWKEILPTCAETLAGASAVHDQFIVQYLRDAHSVVRTFDLEGRRVGEVALPGLGTAAGFSGRRADTETFYVFTGFNTPGTIFHLDMAAGTSRLFRKPEVVFDPAQYETRQVFYSSGDGTRVPMFLTYKKGLRRDGRNPTYLYGYGGFSNSLTPVFSVEALCWMEMGGIYAVPNLRGGGEYGEEWHQAGSKLKKQNVFDDFIGAAEWLIREEYTSSPRLAIGGRSNGGLLVGACLTQRPDLFGAAVPMVGVLDMLRFHKFTIGWAWVSDYGSPENPEEFRALYAYSPLHNVRAGAAYPPTLITTADHDDRVVPAHGFKFAAALQAAQGGTDPVLIRIDTKSGHGVGKPISKLIDEVADRLSFVTWALEMDPGGAAAREARP